MSISQLNKHNFKFSKHFGQNFIFDQNLLQAICNDAGVNKQTPVLEIGAGSGSLTKMLAKNAKFVLSYEIDTNLKPILQENLSEFNNVEVVFGDILKQNITEIEEKLKDPYVLVANLPYYITTPILFMFLDQAKNLTKLTVMVQKEVAERINSKPNTKDYGVITVLINALATTKITRIVKRNMFTPAPNVDSAVITITFNNNNNIKNLNLFKKVVKSSFAMRRKTLYNNLKNSFNFSQETLKQLFVNLNLNENIRAENLSVEDFIKLTNYIENLQK